jgi:hypothetical protein
MRELAELEKDFIRNFKETFGKAGDFGEPLAVVVDGGKNGRVVVGNLPSGDYRLEREEGQDGAVDGTPFGKLVLFGQLKAGERNYAVLILLPARREVVEEMLKAPEFKVRLENGALLTVPITQDDRRVLKAAYTVFNDFSALIRRKSH